MFLDHLLVQEGRGTEVSPTLQGRAHGLIAEVGRMCGYDNTMMAGVMWGDRFDSCRG